MSYRNYGETNIAHLIACLQNVSYMTFLFPFEEFKQSLKYRNPWISSELLRRINECKRLFQLFLRSRNQDILCNYKTFCNKLSLDTKKAKRNTYENKFSSVFNDPATFCGAGKNLACESFPKLTSELLMVPNTKEHLWLISLTRIFCV